MRSLSVIITQHFVEVVQNKMEVFNTKPCSYHSSWSIKSINSIPPINSINALNSINYINSINFIYFTKTIKYCIILTSNVILKIKFSFFVPIFTCQLIFYLHSLRAREGVDVNLRCVLVLMTFSVKTSTLFSLKNVAGLLFFILVRPYLNIFVLFFRIDFIFS